jgi:hypothetical protein
MQKSNTKLTVQKQCISKLSFNILDIIVNGCLGEGGGGGGATIAIPTNT